VLSQALSFPKETSNWESWPLDIEKTWRFFLSQLSQQCLSSVGNIHIIAFVTVKICARNQLSITCCIIKGSFYQSSSRVFFFFFQFGNIFSYKIVIQWMRPWKKCAWLIWLKSWENVAQYFTWWSCEIN